ncbi:SEC-C domain-containing protein [Candidatus Woesearchaeota archaeon]|nr:SEC-C domain-containing protein [Candidatus Woesearchaeota archaeon]
MAKTAKKEKTKVCSCGSGMKFEECCGKSGCSCC